MQLYLQTDSTGKVQSILPGCRTVWRRLWSNVLPVVLLVSCIVGARAAAPAAMPHLDEVTSNQSVFVDDVKFGRDPFFPASTRRMPKVITPANPLLSTPEALDAIALKGISGLAGKRLALLNNRTLGAGEVMEVKFNNRIVKVICVEILEKSVILGIEGTKDTKEIHLRAGM